MTHIYISICITSGSLYRHKHQYSQQIPRLVGEHMGTYMIIYYITNDISNSGIVSLSLGIVKNHINILLTELEVNFN